MKVYLMNISDRSALSIPGLMFLVTAVGLISATWRMVQMQMAIAASNEGITSLLFYAGTTLAAGICVFVVLVSGALGAMLFLAK